MPDTSDNETQYVQSSDAQAEEAGGTATAVAEAPEGGEKAATDAPPYTIKLEDAGPTVKKVSVEIPSDYISGKVAEQFKELRQGANLPGFRKGHVPASLIKKKFEKDIKDQVRRTLIQETYEKAIEKHSLQVLGEPEFEDIAKVELKDGEPLNFTFTVELQPIFELPELTGIKVKKPKISVTDEHINQALQNLTEQQGTQETVTEGGAQAKDFLTSDVHFKVDGNVILHQHDMTLIARPGRVAGLMIEDLDKQLEGLKPGEVREIGVKAPDDFPAENIRGKDVKIEVTLKELKRTKPAVIDRKFLDELGFADEAELREALREQMDERITFDVQNAMRRQVAQWLYERVNIDLPPRLSTKQTGRVVARRAIEMMHRGVPRERIEANMEKLRDVAASESARELKHFFILQKLGEEKKIEVGEAELNTRIAMIALQRGERPEKVKQEMSKQGDMLMNLYVQMREEKALDVLLQTAEITEVDPEELAAEQKALDEKMEAERKASLEAAEKEKAAKVDEKGEAAPAAESTAT